jgi:hypothetical protein
MFLTESADRNETHISCPKIYFCKFCGFRDNQTQASDRSGNVRRAYISELVYTTVGSGIPNTREDYLSKSLVPS